MAKLISEVRSRFRDFFEILMMKVLASKVIHTVFAKGLCCKAYSLD